MELRHKFLDEVFILEQTASRIPGVTCIATISKPLIELWSEVVARVPLTEDVVEKVTRPL